MKFTVCERGKLRMRSLSHADCLWLFVPRPQRSRPIQQQVHGFGPRGPVPGHGSRDGPCHSGRDVLGCLGSTPWRPWG